jgi:hypothetical protein
LEDKQLSHKQDSLASKVLLLEHQDKLQRNRLSNQVSSGGPLQHPIVYLAAHKPSSHLPFSTSSNQVLSSASQLNSRHLQEAYSGAHLLETPCKEELNREVFLAACPDFSKILQAASLELRQLLSSSSNNL